jgi:hypothetical protein
METGRPFPGAADFAVDSVTAGHAHPQTTFRTRTLQLLTSSAYRRAKFLENDRLA